MSLSLCSAEAAPIRFMSSVDSFELADQLKNQKPLLFSDALQSDFDSFTWNELEPSYIDQAKEYLKYRTSRRKFESPKSCGEKDVFCEVEVAFPKPPKNVRTKEKALRLKTADLESAQSDLLESADFRSIMRTLHKVRTPKALEKMVKPALSHSQCMSKGALYVALGSKSEEFFPDPTWVQYAYQLYQRGSDCGKELPNMTARFRLALLQLSKDSCDNVISTLSPILDSPEANQYHLRSRYWIYYCATRENKSELARETRKAIERENPLSFHNFFISQNEGGPFKAISQKEIGPLMTRSFSRPDLNAAVTVTEILIHMKEYGAAQDIAERTFQLSQGAEIPFRLYLVTLSERLSANILTFTLLTQIFRDAPDMINETTTKLFFPLNIESLVREQTKDVLDHFLVLSLIRQESAFNPRAYSPAGAVGFMQLMPRTARRLKHVSKRQLFEPKTNIEIGVRYLIRRLQQHSGDVELTLAGYNAGDGKVEEWLKRYNVTDRMLFLDLIPYRETREYVTAILRNYVWYIKLYTQKSLKERLSENLKNYSSSALFPVFGKEPDGPIEAATH